MIKKMLIRLPVLFLVMCLTMSLLCVAALADNTVGQVNQADSSVSIVQSTTNGDPTFRVTKSSGVSAGEIYLVLIQKGAANSGRPIMPNRDNVYYMNCETATGSSISFNAYPRALDVGDYTVYLSDYTSGNSGAARVAGTFTVSAAGGVQYCGDLDGNGIVAVEEISEIIVSRSRNTLTAAQIQSADVDNNGIVEVEDISQIIVARSQGRKLQRTN